MYNKSDIMRRAWSIYHAERCEGRLISFSDALTRSWAVAKVKAANDRALAAAIQANEVREEVKTWYGWKESGREVLHGSKALFQVRMMRARNGKAYTASYFGLSQTTDEPQEAKAA